jgi:hypothetical protein
MDYQEFMRRINHNYSLANRVLAGTITAMAAVMAAATWQRGINEPISSHLLQANFHDIITSMFQGHLANLDQTGPDAYDMDEDGTIGFFEHKSCDVNRNKIWRNQNGALFHGAAVEGKIPSGLTSQIQAAYKLGNLAHRNTKRLRTILTLFDVHSETNCEAPVAAWELDGDWLVENRLTKSGSVTVTVGSFINHGREISFNPRAPLMGWDAWINELKTSDKIPVYRMHASRVVRSDG